jgi:flagellar biosynthesis/type III secretory pathway protein FliH
VLAALALPDGQRAILRLFSYLSRVAPNVDPKDLTERIQRAIPERNDIVSTLAEKWLEQGEKKGRNEGRRETVRRLVELKFGVLDASAVAQLEAADDAALSRYIERVLTATSVGEVLGE